MLKLANYDEQIQAQQEVIDNGTLKAAASGYITYVKQFPYENQVTSAENVVVIADYEDTYISVQNKTIKDEILKKYDKYYTMQDGQKIALQEYPYSAQERMAAENQMKYPDLRMQYEVFENLPSIVFTPPSVPPVLEDRNLPYRYFLPLRLSSYLFWDWEAYQSVRNQNNMAVTFANMMQNNFAQQCTTQIDNKDRVEAATQQTPSNH